MSEQKPSDEQKIYAELLDKGMKLGLFAVIVSFFLYITGILPPAIPLDELPRYWAMPVGDYLAATGQSGGWSWVTLVGKGDYLNFIGIVILSGITILCYLAILPTLLRKRDTIYLSIAGVTVLILTFAASGILTAGAH